MEAHESTVNESPLYARVALPLPVDRLFTYEVPPDLAPGVFVGCRASVQFGTRTLTGIVVEITREKDVPSTKPILTLHDIFLTEPLLRLARWIASYYGCSLGEAVQAVLPPGLRKAATRRRPEERIVIARVKASGVEDELRRAPRQLGLLQALEHAGGAASLVTVLREWDYPRYCVDKLVSRGFLSIEDAHRVSPLEVLEDRVLRLTGEQERALERITESIRAGRFGVFLLHGVTGSGKTEIYVRAAEQVVAQGGGAIVLVPEISLLPQAVARYMRVFGDGLAVIHSRLGAGERYELWRKIARGECRVVLGPRSAVFSPVQGLRLIVVDEEQDDSYKQEEKPRYHARNVALMRGKFESATVILGSATPSAESYRQSRIGKYVCLSLPSRVQEIPLPEIAVIDMRKEEVESEFFSRPLLEELEECIGGGRQCILFLNKRGHWRYVRCGACGWVARCPDCDISLTYHRVGRKLRCHFCGFTREAVESCPECAQRRLYFGGAGTQRIELDLQGFFPGVKVLRMDADTTAGREGHRRILERFASGRYPILLGTQMVTKGHHFPGVRMVGVITAEEELNFPDFRSAERTFRQLVQVSGRAGRIGSRGKVVIQTFMPDHPVFRYLVNHDYEGFMNEELETRRRLRYPPFARLISAVLSARKADVLSRVAAEWADALRESFGNDGVDVLGPAPPLVARLKGRYREQILLKGSLVREEKRRALELFEAVRSRTKGGRSVDLRWDVDPETFF